MDGEMSPLEPISAILNDTRQVDSLAVRARDPRTRTVGIINAGSVINLAATGHISGHMNDIRRNDGYNSDGVGDGEDEAYEQKYEESQRSKSRDGSRDREPARGARSEIETNVALNNARSQEQIQPMHNVTTGFNIVSSFSPIRTTSVRFDQNLVHEEEKRSDRSFLSKGNSTTIAMMPPSILKRPERDEDLPSRVRPQQ